MKHITVKPALQAHTSMLYSHRRPNAALVLFASVFVLHTTATVFEPPAHFSKKSSMKHGWGSAGERLTVNGEIGRYQWSTVETRSNCAKELIRVDVEFVERPSFLGTASSAGLRFRLGSP